MSDGGKLEEESRLGPGLYTTKSREAAAAIGIHRSKQAGRKAGEYVILIFRTAATFKELEHASDKTREWAKTHDGATSIHPAWEMNGARLAPFREYVLKPEKCTLVKVELHNCDLIGPAVGCPNVDARIFGNTRLLTDVALQFRNTEVVGKGAVIATW